VKTNEKYTYTEVMQKRKLIREKFPEIQHQLYRQWPGSDNTQHYKVMSFGSGPVNNSQVLELKRSFRELITVDSDPMTDSDFLSLGAVAECDFDLIVSEHTIEHILFDDCADLFSKFKTKLKPGGGIFLTLPDIQNHGAWFCDYDHKNFTPWWDLCALLELEDFDVKHVFNWSSRAKSDRLNAETCSDADRYLMSFMWHNYGLSIADYVSIHAVVK
jgi:predicted SAM-dependent methyltransferase